MAQDQAQRLQISGYVVAGDSLEPQAGVVVYVPGTKRGTLTKQDGYFSFPVLAGDSVVISSLGFEKQFVKIPETSHEQKFVVEIKLKASVTLLPMVKVMPWATEQAFKQAMLQVELPEEPQVNLDFQYVKLKSSILNLPTMDAKDNFKVFKNQQKQQRESRFRAPDVIKLFSIPIQ